MTEIIATFLPQTVEARRLQNRNFKNAERVETRIDNPEFLSIKRFSSSKDKMNIF